MQLVRNKAQKLIKEKAARIEKAISKKQMALDKQMALEKQMVLDKQMALEKQMALDLEKQMALEKDKKRKHFEAEALLMYKNLCNDICTEIYNDIYKSVIDTFVNTISIDEICEIARQKQLYIEEQKHKVEQELFNIRIECIDIINSIITQVIEIEHLPIVLPCVLPCVLP